MWRCSPLSLRLLVTTLVALLLCRPAEAFTFSFNQTNPKQCEPVDVRWLGGEPPFQFMIVPEADVPFTVDLDNSTWDAATSTGAFVWHANYPRSIGGFVAVMSDARGLATGGVSTIMQVALGGDADACDVRPDAVDARFSLYPQSRTVQQCSKLGISWPANITDSATIIGVIPHGDVFIVGTAADVNSRNWTIDIEAGTTFLFTMLDSGPTGNAGSSYFLRTLETNDTSCMDPASPSQTPGFGDDHGLLFEGRPRSRRASDASDSVVGSPLSAGAGETIGMRTMSSRRGLPGSPTTASGWAADSQTALIDDAQSPSLHRSPPSATSLAASSQSPSRASSTPPVMRATKQMFALANADADAAGRTRAGPSRPFVRHRDAGPAPNVDDDDDDEPQLELPPDYDEIGFAHRHAQERPSSAATAQAPAESGPPTRPAPAKGPAAARDPQDDAPDTNRSSGDGPK